MVYQRVLRPVLFRLSARDPERAHEWVMRPLAALSRVPLAARLAGLAGGLPVASPRLEQQVFGLAFPNPVGLAAGFDKNAVALPALAALGFGFIEAGTVTYHAQPGNPRPRIHRLAEQQAVINRLGFNNAGAAAVARRLTRTPRLSVPLGISLGKSKVTPLEQAVADYRASLRLLLPYAGYIAVNVSSPNTPGLRALQERGQIDALLEALLHDAADHAAHLRHPRPPLLVKVAPDLTGEALDELLEVCLARSVDGVIAVNTTVGRADLTPRPPSLRGKGVPEPGSAAEIRGIGLTPRVSASRPALGTPFPRREGGRGVRFEGGLSGRPLFPRAVEVVRHIHTRTGGRLPIIGVGGIFTAADAYAMIRAGASLVQVYTGFLYEGPGIVRRINRGLLRLMDRDGVDWIGNVKRET